MQGERVSDGRRERERERRDLVLHPAHFKIVPVHLGSFPVQLWDGYFRRRGWVGDWDLRVHTVRSSLSHTHSTNAIHTCRCTGLHHSVYKARPSLPYTHIVNMVEGKERRDLVSHPMVEGKERRDLVSHPMVEGKADQSDLSTQNTVPGTRI